jgi:hypothetical protein
MIYKIAYKTFTETNTEGLNGYPSDVIQIDETSELDYIDAGYNVSFIFEFEAYKESMAEAYGQWVEQYHPAPKKVVIADLVKHSIDPLTPPVDIDFIAGLKSKLHRKSTIVKGEIRKEEYYLDYDGTTYSTIVVKEETSFTRNSLGFPLYKDVVISWALEDGTFHPVTKSWRKFYSQIEQVSEGKYRRGNLIDSLMMPTLGLMSMALNNGVPSNDVILEGRRFLAEYKIEFSTYIDDSNKDIISCLANPSHPRYASVSDWVWIDFMTPYGVSIRNYLISELTI